MAKKGNAELNKMHLKNANGATLYKIVFCYLRSCLEMIRRVSL